MTWIVVDLSTPDRPVIRGHGGGALARDVGARPVHVGSLRGWLIEDHRVPDLLALMQHRGVRHRVIEKEVTR